MKFSTALKEIFRRTEDVKSFRFDRPSDFSYDPGQWMIVTIPSENGQLTKHFTISSSPTETEFLEFTKKITDHEFSVALDVLKAGDTATIDGPYGEFTFRGEFPKVGMITGGIGITPVRSMIRYCTDSNARTDITLLYGNRNKEGIVFYDELRDLAKRNPGLKVVHCLSRPDDAWKGRRGHVDQAAIMEEIPDFLERVFYICGPPALVDSLAAALSALQVPEPHIKIEHFPGY
jgi:ferredoxin-NADP reductase